MPEEYFAGKENMVNELLARLGLAAENSGVFTRRWVENPGGEWLESINPSDGKVLGRVRAGSRRDYEECVAAGQEAFQNLSRRPAPARGELIREFGNALRERKHDLGLLITLETGKILSEGLGEVQEMIDMCDFATGLSRQLYGLTLASERPEHRMMEQWHPLGKVGIITAFNFPAAVWAWNAVVAGVGGNASLWKPSPRTPLTAVAVLKILQPLLLRHEALGAATLFVGGNDPALWMAEDERLALVSATGSCAMGREIAPRVAARLGKVLLELGGNNALVVAPSANVELALRAVLFGAYGTAGQRCTTTRRLFLHQDIAHPFLDKLMKACGSIRIGNPWEEGVLLGPMISAAAVDKALEAVTQARREGGELLCGGKKIDRPGFFMEPTLIVASQAMPIVRQETFAPILYAIPYAKLEDAIEWNNSVEQGLASAIFTNHLLEAEKFLSSTGSDCGIVNVNIGTSGAEIGGAFGGEKATGGGREAGSDAWKAYMRRQTCTVNYGNVLPLAQGVRFDV